MSALSDAPNVTRRRRRRNGAPSTDSDPARSTIEFLVGNLWSARGDHPDHSRAARPQQPARPSEGWDIFL